MLSNGPFVKPFYSQGSKWSQNDPLEVKLLTFDFSKIVIKSFTKESKKFDHNCHPVKIFVQLIKVE